ncbi:MAG: hypothetical protein EAZ80_01575 [Runella slithyformis]|nr:MAG: hypothetical protein EAZ80_01575 [Runella slithyformis]TAF48680.1 MAG: hypothetical protein EAZ63_03780 [Runella slithyformis]
MQQNEISIIERIAAPTPRLFAIIRNVGIILATIAAAFATLQDQGISLPEWLTLIVSKVTGIAAAVAAIVAQLTVDFKKLGEKNALASVGDLSKKKL